MHVFVALPGKQIARAIDQGVAKPAFGGANPTVGDLQRPFAGQCAHNTTFLLGLAEPQSLVDRVAFLVGQFVVKRGERFHSSRGAKVHELLNLENLDTTRFFASIHISHRAVGRAKVDPYDEMALLFLKSSFEFRIAFLCPFSGYPF